MRDERAIMVVLAAKAKLEQLAAMGDLEHARLIARTLRATDPRHLPARAEHATVWDGRELYTMHAHAGEWRRDPVFDPTVPRRLDATAQRLIARIPISGRRRPAPMRPGRATGPDR